MFGKVLPEQTRETSGLGDLNAGTRVRVLDGRVPVSIAGEVKAASGYSPTAIPALGNGKRDFTLRGLAGSSFGPIYLTADAFWTQRSGPFLDQVGGSFEAGGRLLDFYTVRGVIRGDLPVGTPPPASQDALFDPATASPRSLTFDFVVGAEALRGVALEAAFSQIRSGRNTLAGHTLEAGFVWSL